MLGTERLRPWPLVGLVLFVLALAGAATLALVLSGGNQQTVGVVVSVASAILTPLISAIAVALWRRRRWEGLDPAATLTSAADDLALAVRREWEQAVVDRRLRRPIPVRWAWSDRPVSGRVEDTVGGADGLTHGRFEPLPGAASASAATVSAGGLAELFAVYAGLGSGRTVVLGAPGAGKSAAAILTVLEALAHREALDDEVRPAVPVPVLLNAKSWEPGRQSLHSWIAERLAADYRFLRAPKYGPDVAARLVRDRRIALFLDGFDELAAESQALALEALDDQADCRLMLFTRSEEYAQAVRGARLHGAAALELRPVPAVVAADYLARWQVAELPAPWRRFVQLLRSAPDSPLARALNSPLTVTLVRDTFPDPADLEELLAPDRFATPTEVEDHLLDMVLPVAYRRRPGQPSGPYDLPHASRWLTALATAMSRHDGEFAWWRVHHRVPARVRVISTMLLGGLVAGATAAVIAALTEEFGERDTVDVGPAAVVGLLLGLAIGLASERRVSPAGGFAGGTRFRSNPGLGLVSGLSVGNATALTVGPALGAAGLGVALAAAFAAGTATSLASHAALQRTDSALPPQSGPAGILRAGLTQGLPAGLATGVPVGLATGVSAGLAYGMRGGLVTGLVIGVTFVLAFGLIDGISAASQHVAAPLQPISAWRQDRRRSLVVGAVFGVSVGVAAGITDAMAMARHDPLPVAAVVGLVTGVAVGVATTIAAALTVSCTWRTTLAFLQLSIRGEGPIRGMRFLEDAHQRGVLRVVGSVYQFRHARLQDRLARPPLP
ncbi:hypothetical protein ABGB16_01090 [Micromonospora sp. B11E3]|uniref:hypothetical protein n=1 Tax=Micromonospora sp. B11E3 TaxID=3153562 RepID=UPI00325CA6A7